MCIHICVYIYIVYVHIYTGKKQVASKAALEARKGEDAAALAGVRALFRVQGLGFRV